MSSQGELTLPVQGRGALADITHQEELLPIEKPVYSPVLSVPYMGPNQLLATALENMCRPPYFIDEKAEAQRSQVTFQKLRD